MKQEEKRLLIGAGVVAVLGVGAYLLYSKSAAASTTAPALPPTTPATPATPTPAIPPQPSPSANYMPPGGNLITLVPGNAAQSEGVRVGDSVSIALPTGALWQASGQNPTSGNQVISWIYSGPGTIYLRWSAPDGSPQQTAMTFYTVSF